MSSCSSDCGLPYLSLYSTIKVWDLAAALDAGSSVDTLCVTTLEVGCLEDSVLVKGGIVIQQLCFLVLAFQ